jgi:hypothetical protein
MAGNTSLVDFAAIIGVELQPWQQRILKHIQAGGTLRMPTELDQRRANRQARAEWLRKWRENEHGG